MNNKEILITATSNELTQALEALTRSLVDAPDNVRKVALDLVNNCADLVCIECSTTSAGVSVVFKLSQRFLDICAAVGAIDDQYMFVKFGHDWDGVYQKLLKIVTSN